MKLYICSSGSYSDYNIEAIFMDKEKALEYTRLLKCDNDIEEFETEDENWINKPHECKYYLNIDYNYDKQFNNDNIKDKDEQRLIEIGRATECAFMNFEEFGMAFPFEIGNVTQLLEWYKEMIK